MLASDPLTELHPQWAVASTHCSPRWVMCEGSSADRGKSLNNAIPMSYQTGCQHLPHGDCHKQRGKHNAGTQEASLSTGHCCSYTLQPLEGQGHRTLILIAPLRSIMKLVAQNNASYYSAALEGTSKAASRTMAVYRLQGKISHCYL